MKIVFISSDVSQSDVLVNSFLDGINYKITNQISLQDIPEDATHVTFIYHENYRFPFTIKERYDLFKQLHDASFNMLSDEEIADLSHVQVFDSSEDIVDSYFVDKQNNRIQPHQFYSYVTDFPFFHYEYIESASLYSELDSYNCDISSDYFNDMIYFFNELQKRNKHIVIDLLTCNFVASKIQDIESHFPNLVMRVSTNDTGNPEYGGDWIMEYTSDETETAYVKDIYFNEHISHFSIVLNYNYEISYRTNETDYYYDPSNTDNGYEIKFRVRNSDGYLSRVWSLRGEYLNKERSVTTIFIPSAVKLMTYYSRFSDYGTTSAVETNGIKILKFHDRNNTDLTIQASTFREHPSIEEIHIDQPNIILDSGSIFRKMTKLKKLVLTGSDITSLPDNTASYCDDLLTVELGSTITTIGSFAFYSDNCLNTINLNDVQVIGTRSFQYCDDLNNIGSLSNVTTIGSLAFYNCYSLTSVDLTSVTEIQVSAFYNCNNLQSVSNLNSSLSKISNYTFSGCNSLTTINLSSVEEIFEQAFLGCNSLTSINLSAVNYLGSIVFSSCSSLSNVVLGSNLTTIFGQTFEHCTSLTTINLEYIERMLYYAFYGCNSLTSIDLSNIQEIGEGVFSDCSLSLVILGTSLTTIDSYAFGNNGIIDTFIFPIQFDWSNNSNVNNETFLWYEGWSTLFVPTTITNLYYDSSFGTISSDSSFNGGTVVNAIGYEVSGNNVILSQYSTLTEINGKTVQFLDSVFSSSNYIIRSNGDKVKLNTETTITSSTFTDTDIQSGDTLVLNAATSIANDAFRYEDNNTYRNKIYKNYISNVQFSSLLESIGKNAFKSCTGLTSLDLSNCTSLISIGQDTFRDCTGLTNVDFSGCTSLTTINGRAFYNCDISSINLENTIVNFINSHAFYDNPISSLRLSPTLIKLKEHVFEIPSSGLSELFLPPDISFNNNSTSANSYISAQLLKGSSGSITNLYYNSANGSIVSANNNWPSSDDPISITNAIGYTIDGSNLLLSTDSYAGSSGRTIWGYTISESTNITLSEGTLETYTIGLSNVTSATTFTFTRSDTFNYLIKVAFTDTTSTDISYTNAVTSETQTISSSNIKAKYFNSDLAMTLNSGRTDTITIQYISKSNFDGNIGGTHDTLEAYDIESTQLTISNPISDITFIDSSLSNIDFNNKGVHGLRFSGSFTIPDVTNANTTTINSLYHKYSIVNDKLYDKLYFTLQNVSINRDFSDNYGSEHTFDITSNKYYINGLETPQLQLQSGKIYDCSFSDSSFGIFEDISNTTDPNGFNENIFGGTGSSSSSDFVITSNTIDTIETSVGNNYYYGHLTTHGVGGLNNNISVVETISGNWIQSKNTEHSNIITCYKVKEYPDILHHIYNHSSDGSGRILQIPDSKNINGNEKGYINGYYNPKMDIKAGSDVILEIPNFVFDSNTNVVSGTHSLSQSIYIKTYDSNNTFTDIYKDEHKILNISNVSLQYLKIRCVDTNYYYINHDSIQFINIDVSDTMTDTISFERFDFDLELGSITSPISRLDQSLFLSETRIRSNNVDSSLAYLTTLTFGQSPKIRFTIEDQYTDDPLLTYLFYFKKIEYYGNYLKTISTPYFSDLNESISLNPLQTSFPFRAYMGSFVVTMNGKTHNVPIYTTVNEISKSDMDNLIYMISITGGLKTEGQIKNTLVNKFNVNTSIENHDKSSIIELFLQQQMKRNLSKLSTTIEKQTINILGKPRTISTFFNTDEPNNTISSLTTTFKNSGLSSSTYKPMTFGHSITGPMQIVIQDPNSNDRVYYSHDKLFIITHNIRTYIDKTTGTDISFDTFITKRMNDTTQDDVDISINYYSEYKYPRREFDVTISGGKFEISYTSGSQYNSDVSGIEVKTYTGSALDENGNLNCNENEIYIFNQNHVSNLDSNGVLDHALTVYPVDTSGNPMKYANVNCIPTLGGPLSKTRIFHCFKPKFFSEQMDTTKYYFGSLREALDVSFGEWWMNELHDGTNINIIVDIDNYDSPTSFRFLQNHIRSIPSSKIKQFIDINGSSYIVDDISSIKLEYSGTSIDFSNTSSLYFHFDLSSETINISSDTTLGVGTFSHVTTNDHHIGSSDISSITIEYNNILQEIQFSDISSMVIDGSITNSDISVNTFDYEQLYIEASKTYVFKPSSYYLNSDLSRSFVAVDVTNNEETILDDNNISITNTNSIQFKNGSTIYGTFGSSYNTNNEWSFIDTSMGAYINILPTISTGNSKGYSYENSVVTKSRDALEIGQGSGYSTISLNNQRLHPIVTNTFDIFDSIQ